MRNTFVNQVYENAKNDKDIIIISGDLGYNVLSCFYDKLPSQFLNSGISEQNMTSIAAGLALEGKKVFTYSIVNFPTLRCLEQIRNDILYHNANVKIVSVGCGLSYGPLGMSHHGTEDLGVMRTLPNITIFTPSDLEEAKQIADIVCKIKTPAYIRLGKNSKDLIHNKPISVSIGKAIEIIKGNDVSVFVAGDIAYKAKKAVELLNNDGYSVALYSFPTVKPIDESIIEKCALKNKLIITVEEHNIIGGLGSAVSEIMSSHKNNAILKRIGLNDTYCNEIGDRDYLDDCYKINEDEIIKTVKEFLD